ncbi:DUF4880 domain-containing protein [Thauera sp. SDU_THAU2]|uniref:DUF4880 domain-containing protein n=1 Tax=Thauera sp. SDU_THAU2 TaxID=3136633 RepID=UPI00311D5371
MSPAARSNGNPPDASDFEVLQQAAEWFAVLGAPAVSPAQRQAWQAWRDADARHQAAWQQVENICGAFSHLPTADKAGARRALDTASERQLTRRRAAKMLLLLCGTGTLGWTAVRHTPWATWNAEYKTATGERRQVMLADGGGIWLNSASAIDVDYSGSLRRIHLHAGEILIQTALDLHQLPRPSSSTPPTAGCAPSAPASACCSRMRQPRSRCSRARSNCSRKQPARRP